MPGERPFVDHSALPSRYDESHPPTGPRIDRPQRSNTRDQLPNSYDRPHEQPNEQPLRQQEHEPRRISQDSRSVPRQQDPNYGRLNPVSDVPSGPRRNVSGRDSRNGPTQAHVDIRQPDASVQSVPFPPPNDRSAPMGPSSGRTAPHSGPNRHDQATTPQSSAPPTPAGEQLPPEYAGVHPDRLKGIQRTPDTPEYAREGQRPEPARAAPTPQLPPLVTAPPSGPRNPHHPPQSPVGPSTPSRNPPNGPSPAGERGRGDRRYADIQNVLQQTGPPVPERNDRIPSSRGRGGRDGPPGDPYQDPGPPPPSNERPDLIPRPNGFTSAPLEDGHLPPRNSRSRDQGGRDQEPRRTGRHHVSRSHSQSRDPDVLRHGNDERPPRPEERPLRQEERPSRREEHRERRPPEYGEREGRRGREEPRDKDRRDPRDPREYDESRSWSGGASGRDTRGGERRDDRERESSRRDGRKRGRATDEPPLERDKRPRRNP
ncbi:MAG: THO complex subunit 2 [Piccolia ochrophora]|nr:MAG: THO complex subunit 2 [Piccolia ochrophora]